MKLTPHTTRTDDWKISDALLDQKVQTPEQQTEAASAPDSKLSPAVEKSRWQ
ncbi:MAG: hypothetical protein KME27_29570 [Lyngbya sp. HA4199-MV5]|jgi:hypothetical protein|nr:hypothetical protein [Lyngbya sp. HA4199-MV5]